MKVQTNVLFKRSVVKYDTKIIPPEGIFWNPCRLDPDNPIMAHFSDYPRRTSPKWDIHVGFEMGIILRGRVNRWHGRFRQTLTKGQVWLCNAWEPHGFCVLDAPCRVLVILLWSGGLAMAGAVDRVDYLSPFRLVAPSRPQARTAAVKKRILSIARQIVPEDSHTPIRPEKRLLLTRLLLLELMDQHPAAAGAALRTAGANATPERIMPVLKLIHDNPYRRITLQEAARAARISSPLLVRLFRTMMGTTFGEYALRSRLAALAMELRSGETKLSALAKKYGFVDAAHLSKTFKSCFGQTPSNYRGK